MAAEWLGSFSLGTEEARLLQPVLEPPASPLALPLALALAARAPATWVLGLLASRSLLVGRETARGP